jgi:hypothetical protein
MTATHNGLLTLFASLANRGVMVVAWYEHDHAIGLVVAGGHVIEVERRRACGEPLVVADMLAQYLPRRSVPREYDPSGVPDIAPFTARWWEFLRWYHAERCEGVKR